MDIYDRFVSVSKKNSGINALIENGAATKYSELFLMVTQISSLLNDHSAKRVIILMESGSTAFAAMFACLGFGCQYSPIDINSPKERLRHIFNIYKPDLVFTSDSIQTDLSRAAKTIKLRKNDLLQDTNTNETRITSKDIPEIAYTIFTSGSTGTPKGVAIPREGLDHYINWATKAIRVKPGERWSQHPNIGFDLSVLDIYGALCQGATLVPVLTDADRMFPALFIKRNSINIWNSVPSVVSLMIKANQFTSKYITSLRFITFCGEPLPGTVVEDIFKALPDAIVQNTYGPTEATVSCTEVQLNLDNYSAYIDGNCALGTAIEGMSISIKKDKDNQNTGEIMICGPQVALGYIGADPNTNKKFFTNQAGNRCFKSGDIAKDIDGQLYFVSRNDSCLKINGRFVDLSGIESNIDQLTKDKSCCFVYNNRIYASIQTHKNIDIAALRDNLTGSLLRHEVPVSFLLLEQFPLSGNDKIDRKQLINLFKSSNSL